MASPTRFHSSKTTLGAAVEAFFADRDLAPVRPASRRPCSWRSHAIETSGCSRYVRPGTKAVAQLTAEHDPARRGKHPRR